MDVDRLQRQHGALLAIARFSVQDWPESLWVLLELVARVLEVDRCGFWIRDTEADRLRSVALFDRALGGRQEGLQEELIASQHPHYFQALEEGIAIDASDAWEDPRTRSFLEGYLKPLGIRAMLDVPVRRAGAVVGVLCSEHRAGPRVWHLDEVRFAAAAAERIVLMLEARDRYELADRLAQFMANASDLICQLDLKGRLLYVNEAVLRLGGYRAEELLGRSVLDLFAPEHRREVRRESIRNLKLGRSSWYGEHLLLCRDGQKRWVGFTVALHREGDRPAGFDVIGRDLTERKRMEEALQASERRYRMLFDAVGEAILISDPEGRYIEVNRQAEQLTGYSRQELLQMTVGDLVEGDREELNRGYREHFYPLLVREKRFHASDRQMRRKSGEVFDYEVTAVLLEDGNIMALVRDVSERRRIEKALREAKEQAEVASRIKSHFLAMISHELRTPLHTIVGYHDLIREALGPHITPEVGAFFKAIEQGAQRLLHLVHELIDMARIEAGDLELLMQPQPALGLVRQAFEALAPKAHQKGLLYELEVSDPDLEVRVDGERLVQVLLNLIENAIKFTPSGAVRVRLFREGSEVVISVSDTGVGIDPDHFERLFEPFRQAREGYNRPFEGAGLGLAISYRLVRAMGGRLCGQSHPGRGTTFFVRLPEASRGDRLNRAWRPTTYRALVLEPDPEERRYLEAVLRRAGFVGEYHEDPERLWGALRARRYDVVLLELPTHKPDVGCELARRIRDMGFQGRLVGLTAHLEDCLPARWEEAGGDALLVRPYRPRQLLEWLKPR